MVERKDDHNKIGHHRASGGYEEYVCPNEFQETAHARERSSVTYYSERD